MIMSALSSLEAAKAQVGKIAEMFHVELGIGNPGQSFVASILANKPSPEQGRTI